MPGFEDLHLTGAVATALEGLGWSPSDGAAREVAPTAARGHNLVAVTPPVPAYAAPALAGLLSRVAASAGETRAVLLCPTAELDEWGALAHALTRATSLRIQVAHGTSRALRRLRTETLDLLVASPETALALLKRSALKLESVGAVLLAWPETWEQSETLSTLMGDLPKDAQRIVYTAGPERVADLVERYARKALTVGTPPAEAEPVAAAGPVRTVSVAWQRRAAALGELVELLDPTSLVVWAADRSHEPAILRALPLSDPSVHFVVGDADLPTSQYVVAFDLPPRERLTRLLAAGEVVLLAPPTTEAYVARIANPRRPLRLPGLVDAITTAAGARRAAIQRQIESARPDQALATIAPLFERHDPAAVAAALYDLWTQAGAGAAGAGAVPGALPDIPATAKVFIGVGKKDGATANDIVAVLTKELRVDRGAIGRIELKDAFSLVELPAQDAERIAQSLNGTSIRRKRVTARVDRGPRTDRPAFDRGERGDRSERGPRPERGDRPRGERSERTERPRFERRPGRE